MGIQASNTSFVERKNLTCRQCNGRLSRKVLSFSKDLTWLEGYPLKAGQLGVGHVR
jgi:IS1 family transposase